MSLLTADQEKMVEYLKMNFGKPSDTALFTSLKTIYDNSAYTSATESNQVLVLSNTTSLMNSLGIPGGIPWSWIVNQVSTTDYTLTVTSNADKTQMAIIVQPYPSGGIKTFLTSLHNAFGLENFQFRCIDQKNNGIYIRMGRFPSNFNTLFSSSYFAGEIRPIFCDNKGMIAREHLGGNKHKIRSRILEKKGRGVDANVTLPLYLNSALADNAVSSSSLQQGENLNNMYNQIDPVVQADYVSRSHVLYSAPAKQAGFGKAKILNDFHNKNQRGTDSASGTNDFYLMGDDVIPTYNTLGPKDPYGNQEEDKMFFYSYGFSSSKPYVRLLSAAEINTTYKSDTPTGDSDFNMLEVDLANYCRHKRYRMNYKRGGRAKRGAFKDNLYTRVQYTVALVGGKIVGGHYKVCAIIPDQGRFFDFEEPLATTKEQGTPMVKCYVSNFKKGTSQDYYYFTQYSSSVLQFSSMPYSLDGNKFIGIDIGTDDGKKGYLKKDSISGNNIYVSGLIGTADKAMISSTTPVYISVTLNKTNAGSNKTIGFTMPSGRYILGATLYFNY